MIFDEKQIIYDFKDSSLGFIPINNYPLFTSLHQELLLVHHVSEQVSIYKKPC